MATTIYTYLHNDDLNGSRIVSMDDCMCKLYNIMRDDSDFLNDFERDLKSPALYVLINKENSKAYIGETDDFIKRISQHIIKKKFWTEVMVFLGTNEDTLSKTEVQYLEYLALEKAKQVKSYDLSENTQGGKIPHMNVIQKGKTDKFFKYVQFLAKFVGCDIFEKRFDVIFRTSLEAVQAKVVPVEVVTTPEDLKGRVLLSLNGKGEYTKREFVWHVVDEFLKKFPQTSFAELRATFKRDYLQRFSQFEFLSDDINAARNWKNLGFGHCSFFIKDEEVLTSGDGIDFVVCVEWDRNNLIKILGIVQALGWKFEIIKEGNVK